MMSTRPFALAAVAVLAFTVFAAPAASAAAAPAGLTRDFLRQADVNGDTFVSFDELKSKLPWLTAEMFDSLDVSGDGMLSLEDLDDTNEGDLLLRIRYLFVNADADHDAALTLQEVQSLLPWVSQAAFDQLDRDGDGILTVVDLPAGAHNDPIVALLRLLRSADTNGDGAISYDEAQMATPFDLTPAMFGQLDRDGDGLLTANDLPEGNQADLTEQILRLFALADGNSDGQLTIEEIRVYIPSFPQQSFEMLDRNGDGVLSREDLPAPAADEPLQRLLALLKIADLNGDGAVSYEELDQIIPGFPTELYAFLDVNGDGLLTLEDLPLWAGQVDRLRELIAQADENGDHALTYEEVVKVVPQMTAAQFDYLDRDGDGFLTTEDVPSFGPEDPLTLLRRLLAAADADHNGELTLAEIQAVVPEFPQSQFDRLDRNGDGVLSAADLPDRHEDAQDPWSLLVRLLKEADADGDASVSLPELEAALPNLSPDAVGRLFNFLDRNGDDALTVDDLPVPAPDDPLAQLVRFLALADANDDHQVTLDEVRALVPEFPQVVFDRLDRNDDGVLSVEDLPNEPPAYERWLRLMRLLNRADSNNDNQVTLDEALAALPGVPQNEVEALFNRLDTNGDGLLTVQDLAPLADEMRLHLARLLREADADGDNEVSLAEIQALVPEFPQQLFDMLDRNGDGLLSIEDLPATPPFDDPRQLLLRLFRTADADNDGVVTRDELLLALPDWSEEQVDALIERLDRNDDGVLSADDLPSFPPDPAEVLLHILRLADTNGDAQVTFEELAAVVPGLTQVQFDLLDRNGDGIISVDDRPVPPVDPIDRALQLLREADVDDNGEVTFDELHAVLPELTQALFDRLDRNDDGVLSEEDLPEAPIDPRDFLRRLVREADENGDGALTLAEIQAVLPDFSEERFSQLDRNGDGVLSLDDLHNTPVPPDSDARRQFIRALIEADTNRNGVLEFAEIALAFPDAPAELLAAIDTNGDWAITRAELLAALGRALNGEALIALTDADGDGDIDAVDVQRAVNDALGLLSNYLLADVNGDGEVNALDIQSIINGALGL